MMRRGDGPRELDPQLRSLLGAEGPELTCEQCFELIDEYAELQLVSDPADEHIPGMRAHLEGCSACREEYDSLLALLTSDKPA